MANVFVASSGKAQALAEQVAEQLANQDLHPLRWWQMFRSGDYTLDRLRSLSDSVDGAIIIWDDDDVLWRDGDAATLTTRDNCILEYGLFVSKLGRHRTAVLVRDDVKRPSDVSGVTVVAFNEQNSADKIRQIVGELRKNLKPSSPGIVPVVSDSEVQKNALDATNVPTTWAGRALYVSDGGSRWFRLAKEPSYLLGVNDLLHVLPLYTRIVRDHLAVATRRRLGTILSFSPGDAQSERQLLDALASEPSDRLFEWIPVDLSPGLLQVAIGRLQNSQAIPMGIVGDPEEGLTFIFSQLTANDDHRDPMLVTMLGGRLSNVDLTEEAFLSQLKARLQAGDYFLFDVPVKGRDWTDTSEPRADPAVFSVGMKRFLAGGLAFRLGVPEGQILDDFDTRIKVEQSAGAVPGTTLLTVKDPDSTFNLLRLRRYGFDELQNWLRTQDGFELVAAMQTEALAPDVLRMGVVLLRKA